MRTLLLVEGWAANLARPESRLRLLGILILWVMSLSFRVILLPFRAIRFAVILWSELKFNLSILHSYAGGMLGLLVTKERVFVRGDREVVLVGMVHLAEAKYYEHITQAYGGRGHLVLEEGVSDSEEEEEIDASTFYVEIEVDRDSDLRKMKEVYPELARQPESLFPKNESISGDVSFDKFPKEIRTAIEYHFGTEELKAQMDALQIPRGEFTIEEIDAVVIGLRNDHLWGVMMEHIETRNLIIPWGSAHLDDIDARLRAIGFKAKKTTIRSAFRDSKMMKADRYARLNSGAKNM